MIPKILHRTVATISPTPVMNYCWKSAIDHNPDWVHMSHEEPIDRSNWPITSHLWDKCAHPAFISDLMRLEALWTYGGIYLDSDVLVVRPLDRFISHSPFACKANEQFIANGVMGAPPQHPAIMQLIEDTANILNDGKVALGPDVITKAWNAREDVDIYSHIYFYFVRETKVQLALSDLDGIVSRQKFMHGVHLWVGSWKKKDKDGNDPSYLAELSKLWEE